jgi:phage major head subunit gpT-like protein
MQKENINQDSKGNVTKNNQYVLNFMGITKIICGKKPLLLYQKMKKSQFRALTKKTTMRLHLQNVDFFSIVAINILWISCKM